ncbi:very short patch repair endonuclease [Nevskia soli]|uniref:very short patch repair endonuclease n=1 Tax=Nevskia soli TaxID=418856 RepID=UPI001B80764B|nr:very short patch repair endonuclease [Nevskia soli]
MNLFSMAMLGYYSQCMVVSNTSPTVRRKFMARFKGKDTKPEIIVRKLLHNSGVRFRLHRRDLPGTPDIVLPKRRIAIFINGCFWHHHEGCHIGKIPSSRSEFWKEKFRKNKERDEASLKYLEALGWHAVTIWECEARGPDISGLLRALGLITA